jgi:hypothetical protein
MALRAFRDMVIEQIRPLYQSQLMLAKGITHVYRITIGAWPFCYRTDLQGNLALAQSQANRAVELEFAPVQAKLDYLSKALGLNKDTGRRLRRGSHEAAAIG